VPVSFARTLALLLALLATACTAKDGDLPLVERTKVDYDSTRDGPRPPAAMTGARDAKDEAPEQDGKCTHAWEALPRGTHTYMDASDPPMPALCTPVVCTKCGLVRHECQKRRRR
jgi:hypothetical protein